MWLSFIFIQHQKTIVTNFFALELEKWCSNKKRFQKLVKPVSVNFYGMLRHSSGEGSNFFLHFITSDLDLMPCLQARVMRDEGYKSVWYINPIMYQSIMCGVEQYGQYCNSNPKLFPHQGPLQGSKASANIDSTRQAI